MRILENCTAYFSISTHPGREGLNATPPSLGITHGFEFHGDSGVDEMGCTAYPYFSSSGGGGFTDMRFFLEELEDFVIKVKGCKIPPKNVKIQWHDGAKELFRKYLKAPIPPCLDEPVENLWKAFDDPYLWRESDPELWHFPEHYMPMLRVHPPREKFERVVNGLLKRGIPIDEIDRIAEAKKLEGYRQLKDSWLNSREWYKTCYVNIDEAKKELLTADPEFVYNYLTNNPSYMGIDSFRRSLKNAIDHEHEIQVIGKRLNVEIPYDDTFDKWAKEVEELVATFDLGKLAVAAGESKKRKRSEEAKVRAKKRREAGKKGAQTRAESKPKSSIEVEFNFE